MGKSYYTVAKKNLAATYNISKCLRKPESPRRTQSRAITPKKGLLINKILPRSVTLYYKLFYLVLSTPDTPDIIYKF
ncbi:hypothetical protein N7523_007377 [Penicillium sp. IBT 18751x]|nr:hypothetical protein N7523_007377 [Penicillium sp. IBT 18751x]